MTQQQVRGGTCKCLLFAILVAAWPALVANTEARTSCEIELEGGSGRFREVADGLQWHFHYSADRVDDPSDRGPSEERTVLFPRIEIAALLERPGKHAQSLLASLEAHACTSLPVVTELNCQAERVEGHHVKNDRVLLRCSQRIDGVPARDTRVDVMFSDTGIVDSANISLLDERDITRIDASGWPADHIAVRYAEEAFLRAGGDAGSRRREVFRIERYYSAKGPVVLMSHHECGVTLFDVEAREAVYTCASPPSFPDWTPRNARERQTVVSGLPYYFAPAGIVQAGEIKLLWGVELSPDLDRDVYRGFEGELYAVSPSGDLAWSSRLGKAHNLLAAPQGDEIIFIRVDQSEDYSQTIRPISVSTRSGEQVSEFGQWSVPAGAGLVLQSDGERIIYHWSQFNQSFLAAASLRGQREWAISLPTGLAVISLAASADGDVALLMRQGSPYRDEQYSLLHVRSDGQIENHIVPDLTLRDARVIGLVNGDVFVFGGAARRGMARGTYVRRWNFASGELVDELLVPEDQKVELTERGTLLFSGMRGTESWVGELAMDGSTLWRQRVNSGSRGFELSVPQELGDHRYLTMTTTPSRQRQSQQSVVTLMVVDAQMAEPAKVMSSAGGTDVSDHPNTRRQIDGNQGAPPGIDDWRIHLHRHDEAGTAQTYDLGGVVVASTGEVATVEPVSSLRFACESDLDAKARSHIAELIPQVLHEVRDVELVIGASQGREPEIFDRSQGGESRHTNQILVIKAFGVDQVYSTRYLDIRLVNPDVLRAHYPRLADLVKTLSDVEERLDPQCAQSAVGGGA